MDNRHLHDFFPSNREQRLTVAMRGAMGDFLNAWPALAGLALAAPPGSLALDAREAHLPWAEPLGYDRPDPATRRGLMKLYNPGPWPGELAGCRVLVFGLAGSSPYPPRQGLAYVPGLDRVGFTPPRERYARAAEAMGAPAPADWQARFARLFAPDRPASPNRALLFPGAGHKAKRWPMVKYFELAERLEATGLEPVFVLGPVELEQGLDAGGRTVAAPTDTAGLTRLMAESALAVGNDCGPMHLAGALGLPGVVLFGPTPARQWGPPGLTHLRGQAPCRPCTRDTAGLDCPNPVCMASITPAQVARAVAGLATEPQK